MPVFTGNRFLSSNENEMVAKFAEEAVEVKLDASCSHEILDNMLLFLFGSHDTDTSFDSVWLTEQVDIAKSKEPGEEALDDFTYAGYTIPKRWKLHWSPDSTTKDPVLFSNAEDFDHSRYEGAGHLPHIRVFHLVGGKDLHRE
ncbi:hypothetical protein NC653_009968 [Populus alba x Populus x berolinensis]|uniref:Uncharacterized protein n=1 Tax=Populus alba x Populus x berolinensis TaxID=444605 RepID=A0AAD6RAV0_9ROSI|nr:hypothetical protein NC653_009968 [Populus alba x Populus x berolinensis]